MKKNKRRKNEIILIAITVISSVLALGIIITVFVTHAMIPDRSYKELDREKYAVQYTSHYIKGGETLWSISEDIRNESELTKKFISTKSEVNEITRINKLSNSNNITYGCYVIVPYVVEKGEWWTFMKA